MGKNKRMTTILIAGVLLLTVIGVTFAYFAVSVINGTRQNLSATTVESVNLTLDDNDAASYSGQVSFGSTITRNLKLTNEGGPTKVALYFQDLINTYTAGAFTYTLSYATTENGSYTDVLTDVAIPRRSKASSTAKITEIDMPATSTRYYRIVITYNDLNANQTRDLTAQFNTGFTIKAVPKTIAEAYPDGDYLKDFCGELDTSGNCTKQIDGSTSAWNSFIRVYDNKNIIKSSIYSIITSNSKTPPSGTVYATNGSPWDVSQGQNGSVMAWLVNHTFNKYYLTLNDCNTAKNSGEVNSCEAISSLEKYVFYFNNTYYYDYVYDSLEECVADGNNQDTCASQTFSAIGYYEGNNAYDLYIGQDGGVIANPNSANLFGYFLTASSIDLSNFNTSYVINMNRMFNNCKKTLTLNLSNFDTSNVTDMSYMFGQNTSLSTLDASYLNTENVTNMRGMFSSTEKLTSLNIINFDTANVTNMDRFFAGCKALENISLQSFDTSNVEYMSYMFYEIGIRNLDLNEFDTSSVTDMQYMFYGTKFNTLNVTSFDTSNVTNMYMMFGYITAAPEILDLSSFDTSNVTDMSNMFYAPFISSATVATKVLKLNRFNFDNVMSDSSIFGLPYLETIYTNINAKKYFENLSSSNLLNKVVVVD